MAKELVALRSEKKDLERRIDTELNPKIARREKYIEEAMLDERFSIKSSVSGKTVYLQQQVWASVPKSNVPIVTRIFDDYGLDEYKPSSVNSQSFSAFVRERLDPDESLPIEERLANGHPEHGKVPTELLPYINVTEKNTVKVNGL